VHVPYEFHGQRSDSWIFMMRADANSQKDATNNFYK